MATVFRLDHRGQTADQRAVLTQRGYVATRLGLGLEALLPQLYRETLQRGLGQAQQVLVIADLTELKPRLQEAQQKKLQTQIEYFEHNAHRMKYKEVIAAREAVEHGTATAEQIKLANQPLGSGAIESACRHYQCRFKRTGQFWTTAGDEALLCLETFWRNGRWHELYPHAKANVALN
jgi:hypothetical protein